MLQDSLIILVSLTDTRTIKTSCQITQKFTIIPFIKYLYQVYIYFFRFQKNQLPHAPYVSTSKLPMLTGEGICFNSRHDQI